MTNWGSLAASIGCRSREFAVAFILAIVFSASVYSGSKHIIISPLHEGYEDVWFDADIMRTFYVLSEEKFVYRREGSDRHPLYTLIGNQSVKLIQEIFSIDKLEAIRILTVFIAFCWMFILYLFYFYLLLNRWDAGIFSILTAVSSASVFFFPIPESHSLGSLTIVATLFLTVLSQTVSLHAGWFVLLNVMTLAITKTNWMVGILSTMINFSKQETFKIISWSFVVTTLLWLFQKKLYSNVLFFVVGTDPKHLFSPTLERSIEFLQVFFFHSVVMPEILLVKDKVIGLFFSVALSVQKSIIGSSGIWGAVSTLLWCWLLACGFWALFTLKVQQKIRFVLGLTLLGQMIVTYFYGEESFLFSLHYVVLIIPIVALAALTRARPIVMGLIYLLIPCLFLNNLTQCQKATLKAESIFLSNEKLIKGIP